MEVSRQTAAAVILLAHHPWNIYCHAHVFVGDPSAAAVWVCVHSYERRTSFQVYSDSTYHPDASGDQLDLLPVAR